MPYPEDDSIPLLTVGLVEQVRTGDEDAFERLYVLYTSRIFSYLRGLVGNTEVAHELTQQVFLQVWQHLSQLHDALRFKAWLYRIARNVAIDYERRERKGSYWLSWEQLEEGQTPYGELSFETLLAEKDLLQKALATLPFKLRECLLLQTIGGFSQREIAVVLNLGEQSVSTYMSQARKQLRAAFRRFERDTY
jgi:RNA polymerase sigma-70 factor, ECF subfamily